MLSLGLGLTLVMLQVTDSITHCQDFLQGRALISLLKKNILDINTHDAITVQTYIK